MNTELKTVQEHGTIKVSIQDEEFLEEFVPDILKFKQGEICASNYVGVMTLPSRTILEILPKVFLGQDITDPLPQTRRLLIKMLRCFRGTPIEHRTAKIQELRNFNMLTHFIRQFLVTLKSLVRDGLARQYISNEENLPYLKGRIKFKDHIRLNSINKTHFFSSFDELSVNRPVNRLIVTTLNRLESQVGYGVNRKLLKELQILFADVKASQNVVADWKAHRIDRSMPHYTEIMKWIGLFLFGHGLTTYSGKHPNISLMFPMSKVFEDFVSNCIHRYCSGYRVRLQSPQKYLIRHGCKQMFKMKPDISLLKGEDVCYVLDAKWKELDRNNYKGNFAISQSDLYQLYTYGRQYGSKAVALIFPKSKNFTEPMKFRYTNDIHLLCFPFDVEDAPISVELLVTELQNIDSPINVQNPTD